MPEDVRSALAAVSRSTPSPSRAPQQRHDQLRIAFDGDAVIFGDEGDACHAKAARRHSRSTSATMRAAAFRWPVPRFPRRLAPVAQAFPTGLDAPIRTAPATARPSGARARDPHATRLGHPPGRRAVPRRSRQGPFLEAFGADIFFDDSEHNIVSARDHVAAGHVPHVSPAAESVQSFMVASVVRLSVTVAVVTELARDSPPG